MAEEKQPNCELRCRFCPKVWQGHISDPPKWKVEITICATCYTEIMLQFEKQFPSRRALPKRRIRTEEDDMA